MAYPLILSEKARVPSCMMAWRHRFPGKEARTHMPPNKMAWLHLSCSHEWMLKTLEKTTIKT